MVENNINYEEIDNSEDFVYYRPDGKDGKVVNVLDLIDASVPLVDADTRKERMSICKSCSHFKLGTFCDQCNCVMKFKTWLCTATCPINKW